MPGIEDFKDIAQEMGLTEPPTPPAPDTPPTPPATEPPVVTAPVTPITDPNPATPPATPPAPKPAEPAPISNQEAAAQRIQNKKFKDAITAAAKADGISEDEYLAKLQDGALAKRATEQNVPPEILRRLEAAEQELADTRQKQAQEHLGRQFNAVQEKYKLTDVELTEFAQALSEKGHDFQNTRADYELLYRGLNHDKLVEKDRQAWLADTARAQAQGSNPNQRIGKTSQEVHAIDTMEALDAALANMK